MINLYYDNLITGNGSSDIDSPVRPTISITHHLTQLGIEFTTHQINSETKLDSSKTNLYVIELMYGNKIDEIFKNLSEQALTLLRNDIKLLVYFPYEGFELKLYENWFYKLHKGFIDHNITCKKYFVFNNLYMEDHYKHFLLENTIGEQFQFNKVFGFPYFQFEYYHTVKEQVEEGLPQVKVENLFNKDKDYLCLNSKIRAHRVFLVSELERREIEKNCYLSMMGSTFKYDETTIEFAKNVLSQYMKNSEMVSQPMIDGVRKYVDDWKERLLDSDANNLNDRVLDPKYYESSFFSIVSETGMSHHLRLTEKPFRAIVNYHPYIIVGCHGTLTYLKSLGFETFPELFDESYDNEPDMAKRLLMVINEVEKFVNLTFEEKMSRYKMVHDKVLHNREVFFNKVAGDTINDFKKIFEYIKND